MAKLFQIAHPAGGRGIPSIHESVHENFRHPGLVGGIRQRHQMIDVAVHPAIAHQAKEMQSPPRLPRLRESGLHHRVGSQFPLGDGLRDARQILVNDPAGAEIQMAHLRIAHLSGRQTNVGSAGTQPAVGVRRQKVRVERRPGQHRGVAVTLGVGR